MQFCQPHWDSLKGAIDERGISRFIAPDGAAAGKEAAAQIEGTTDPKVAPDPLMQAHWMITGRVLDIVGLGLMNNECCPICAIDEGHCPLCEVEHGAGAGSALAWIHGCTDDILAEFQEKGWVTA